jgi:hypothetical protein
MPSEAELLNGDFLPSDDYEGMSEIIDNLWNHICRKRVQIIRYIEKNKTQEALDMEAITDKMAQQLDRLIKQYIQHDKYVKLVNPKPKETKSKSKESSVPNSVKNEMSLNGEIVQMIPKK